MTREFTKTDSRRAQQSASEALFLLDDVQQRGHDAFEVDDQGDELPLIELRGRRSSAIEQVESDANEQEFG